MSAFRPFAQPLRHLSRFAIAILMIALASSVASAQKLPEDVLSVAPPPGDDVIAGLQDDQVVRMSFKFVDFPALAGPDGIDGADAVLLRLFDDVELVAIRDRLERRSLREYSWFGTVNGHPETSVILVVRGARLTGSVLDGARVYDIVSIDRDERHAVREIDPALFLHEEPRETSEIPQDSIAPSATRSDVPSGTEGVRGFGRRSLLGDRDTSPVEPLDMHCGNDDWIDVLVVYTADADAAPGDIEGEIQAAIDDSNQSYINSGIGQRLRLVHSAEIAYVESGDAVVDRNRLRDPGDGFLDDAHTLRDTYGADIVSLWTRTSDYCGYAYIMETVDVGFEDRAFNVVKMSCAVGNHSFAHELGHNMSARHDRFVDNTDGSPFAYNHGFVNIDDTWRTIMSYNDACEDAATNCTRLQYWSNPDVSYGGDDMGIADGDPEAADNARTLDDTRATVQDFRGAHAPVADAGLDVVGECGIPSNLDGSGSCDPDDDPLTFTWTGAFTEGGGTTSGVMPAVTFGKGVHTVTLIVDDGAIDSVPDTVEVDTTADLTPPDVVCPADVVISCDDPTDPGSTGSATADDLCDADPDVDHADVETPGDCPQERTIERTWTAADDDGNDSSCLQTVSVDDSTAPEVTCAVATDSLWPPNHKFHDVGFTFETSDDCDADPDVEITVSSDEHPATASGAGGRFHCPDSQVDPETGAVLLRAERSGRGDGRVYVVTVTVTDACGNASSCNAEVGVPKSRANGGVAVDSGQAFDAAVCTPDEIGGSSSRQTPRSDGDLRRRVNLPPGPNRR